MAIKTNKIHRYIWRGRNDINWFQECEELIEGHYGRKDKRLVAQLLAATSINTSMKSNVTLFKKAFAAFKKAQKNVTVLELPQMLPNIQKQLLQVWEGTGLTGRKINSFANAMSGDTQAVVVDIWLLRAFDIDRKYTRRTGEKIGVARSSGATDKQYTLIEDWVRNEAFYMGIEPRQLSAMIWSGMRTTTNGKDFTHYKQVLVEASMELFPKTGYSPEKANECCGRCNGIDDICIVDQRDQQNQHNQHNHER